MTFTLKLAYQSIHMILQLMMMHHNTKFGCKWFSHSKDLQTKLGQADSDYNISSSPTTQPTLLLGVGGAGILATKWKQHWISNQSVQRMVLMVPRRLMSLKHFLNVMSEFFLYIAIKTMHLPGASLPLPPFPFLEKPTCVCDPWGIPQKLILWAKPFAY